MKPVKLISRAANDLISIQTAIDHCKANSVETDLIAIYLGAAIRACENKIQGPILDSVYEMYLPCWSSPVDLEKLNVTAINSVKYYDENGALQTVASANFRSLTFTSPCSLEFDESYVWPTLDVRGYPVVINFNAGYTNAEDVPENIVSAILLETADRYDNRQNEAAATQVGMFSNNADAILNPESAWL